MRALELQRRTDVIDGYYKALKKRKQELLLEIEGLKTEIDILTKTSVLLKHLLDTMVKEEMSKMAGLITYGLKTIFDDQNLIFSPEITKKNDKINIDLNTINVNKGFTGDFESFGGSVSVIESFLLRILCMLKKGYARLMILDETFAAVGEEYLSNTCKLISELSKKLNMDILLVTHHQKEFENGADHVYKVKETPNGLIIENLR